MAWLEPDRLAACRRALFAAAGLLLRRLDRKAHFEPAFVNLGLLMLLGAAVTGAFGARGAAEPAWGAVLAAASGATIVLAYLARRPTASLCRG